MPPKRRLECEVRIKQHNCVIFEAISRWYFDFLIDKNGDQDGGDRHVYLIKVTADQPLNENSTAQGGVGGGLIVIRYSNTR